MAQFFPTIKAQPDKATYPVTELQLSPRLTRAIYLKMFGKQAPAYNPEKPPKRWFFSDALDATPGTVDYKVWDAKAGRLITMTMTAQEAATPNLPGTVVYEKYVNPEATVAQVQVVNSNGATLSTGTNGAYLVDPSVLDSVIGEASAALGIVIVAAESKMPSPFRLVYGTEARRKMNVILPDGSKIDGAAFVANRFAKGIFAPGKWSLNSDKQPVFTPDVPVDGEQDVRPEVPIPCRDLLPNERIESRLDFAAGRLYYIARTDIPSDGPETAPGGMTADQAAALSRIDARVGKIIEFLSIGV